MVTDKNLGITLVAMLTRAGSKAADKKHGYEEGFMWLKQAAENGHLEATLKLGLAYADGVGVNKDMRKAKEWFLKADAAGHEKAQYWITYYK